MTTRREPLTQEEHALAARLARLGVPAGPPAALDAKILAAAHDATLGSPASAQRHARGARRRRWPVAIGAAASLVVVLGLAWQLRPEQDTAQVYSESDFVRAPRASGPSAEEALPIASAVDSADSAPSPPPAPEAVAQSEDPPEQQADAVTAPLPTAPEAQPAPVDAAAARHADAPPPDAFPAEQAAVEPARAPSPAEEADAAAEAAGADIVFDAPAPAAAPPPPAPPAAGANAPAARSAPLQRRQASEKSGAAEAAARDSILATGTRITRDSEGFSDSELDDRPPATADSPQVQRAWLQRIRELVAEGDMERAQASLAEFKRRNPRYALPEDLQALLP